MEFSVKQAAVVGAGAGGLTAYVALRYRGMDPDNILLFDENPKPLKAWADSTSAISQMSMRSESEGHFYATEFPGFALLDALHSFSLAPLVRSVFNRYHPTLGAALTHGQALAQHYGMKQHVRPHAIVKIRRELQPYNHFALYDGEGTLQGRAKHVLLALGHGPLRWPATCCDPSAREPLDGLLYHAYQAKPYGGKTVVVGSGMAAVTEWVNVLRSGGMVVSVRRKPSLIEQSLSAPRCAFGGPWLDHYHSLGPGERAAILDEYAVGTFPRRRSWKKVVEEARKDGRFRSEIGSIISIERTDEHSVRVVVDSTHGSKTETADRVVAATGFLGGWQQHEVLRNLVRDRGLATFGDHLILADDCSVPHLSEDASALVLSGAPARWAFPAADSLAGMKYASRRFVEFVLGRQPISPSRVRAWWEMARAGWPYPAELSDPCATP